jgi:sulfur carrier protein ThiS
VSNLEVELPTGGTLGDIIVQLGIEMDSENTLLVVNGRSVELDEILVDGDIVHLIPAISGGCRNKFR